MKRIVCLCVLLLCSASFVFAQSAKSKSRKSVVKKKTVVSQLAEAEKAWTPFWNNFLEIIKNRNSKGLFESMAEDYNSQYNSTNRNSEIKQYDKSDPDNKYRWEELKNEAKGQAKLIKKGINVTCYGKTKVISKLLPRNWNNITDGKADGTTRFLLFEFRINRWFFVAFDHCETE